MKRIVKKSLLGVALLVNIMAFSAEKMSVKVKATTSKMLSVALTQVGAGETIKIVDFVGEVLFSEEIQHAGDYSKVFNLSALPAGLYFVENTAPDKISNTPILIHSDHVTLVPNAEKIYEAPTLNFEADILSITVKNAHELATSISIYDAAGTLIHTEDLVTQPLTTARYDASALSTDQLVVSVSVGDYSFVEEVDLK